MGWPTPKCGTQGGYQRHKRAGEDACPPCLDAHAQHAREYRKDVALNGPRDQQLLIKRARREAVIQLLRIHEREYLKLFAIELRKLKEAERGRKAAKGRSNKDLG